MIGIDDSALHIWKSKLETNNDNFLIDTYDHRYMQPDLVDGELYLAPNFPAPPNTDYQGYHNYIDEMMPPESPYL